MGEWLEKMQAAIDVLERTPRTLALLPETRQWLEVHGTPAELVELLRAFPFNSPTEFGCVSLTDVNRIPEYNDQPEHAQLKANGLLAIGDCLNGDPIVVNLRTGNVGYINHDDLWEDPSVSIDEVYCDLGLSLPDFCLAAATDDDFPVDFYEAQDFVQAQNSRTP